MASWPRMERMIGTFGATVSRALLESFYATPSTEGLSVIFNRSAAPASAQGHCSPSRGCLTVLYLSNGLSLDRFCHKVLLHERLMQDWLC